MVTVTDCQRVQTSWYAARATLLGGSVVEDGGLLWTDGPDGLNLMFPRTIEDAALGRGLDRARDLGRDIVGAWLSEDVEAAVLAAAGFERGWAPQWMTADLADMPAGKDSRVELQRDSLDYEVEDRGYRDQLTMTRGDPPIAWYAAAYAGEERRFAGRAWSFVDGELAGVFDLDVWPPFRRQGIGTALLTAVCAEARAAGARHAILNATPDGKLLYSASGFRPIGQGITWWYRP